MTEETTEARQETEASDPIWDACEKFYDDNVDPTPNELDTFVRGLMAKHAPKPAEDPSESERMTMYLMHTPVKKLAELLEPLLEPARGPDGYLNASLVLSGFGKFVNHEWRLYAGDEYGRSIGQTLKEAMANMATLGSPADRLAREIEAAEKHVIDLRLKLAAVTKGGAK